MLKPDSLLRSRMLIPLNPFLEQINEHFADILLAGRFTSGGPLPGERDEPDLADLPRLVFKFNRQNHGRLRQLIDCINRGHL